MYVELTGNETSTQVNEIAVKQYMNQLKNIASGDDLRLLEMALRFPDAMKTDKEDIDEEEYKAIKEALIGALKEINEFRSEEGSVLEKDFLDRIASLEKLLEEVSFEATDRSGDTISIDKEYVESRVADLAKDTDLSKFIL